MTDGERSLVRTSAALASRDERAIGLAFKEAIEVADTGQIEEVILQSYLFLGFHASLNGMALWRNFSGTTPLSSEDLDCVGWVDRGQEICKLVYADKYHKLRQNVRDLHPDLEQWMIVEGYGKVLGRPGLSLKIRELCIVASLAVLGSSKQLYSHLCGALNVGANVSAVEEALAEAHSYLDEDGFLMSMKVWNKVQESRVS